MRARNTASDYQRYLDRFPNGLFADDAKARIKELTAGDKEAVIAAARAEESQVVSNGVLRLLAENRLAGIPSIQNVSLTDAQIGHLVEFLTTLTDPCVANSGCLAPWIPDSNDTDPDNLRLDAVFQ